MTPDNEQEPQNSNQEVAQPQPQQLTAEQQAWLQQLAELKQRQQAQVLTGRAVKQGGSLPAASIVYGCAASALLVVAVASVINGSWVNGILILLPALILFGYAMHFLKNG
ncbi:MAG: hypothetical protein JO126_01390 [Alphaproteobacteria bacterium]|nr:hypothetical protein [Alphaproteobacteria bacterium]